LKVTISGHQIAQEELTTASHKLAEAMYAKSTAGPEPDPRVPLERRVYPGSPPGRKTMTL
jgi:hypothetical protein